jgi:hypothetical protein
MVRIEQVAELSEYNLRIARIAIMWTMLKIMAKLKKFEEIFLGD